VDVAFQEHESLAHIGLDPAAKENCVIAQRRHLSGRTSELLVMTGIAVALGAISTAYAQPSTTGCGGTSYSTVPDSMIGVDDPPVLEAYDNGTTKNLGLWWGHSASYADSWNDSSLDDPDRTNLTHRSIAFNEMDGAEEVNARTIALDAFSYMCVWDSYYWLQVLHDNYPGVRFVTEDQHSDLIHTLDANWAYLIKNESGGLHYYYADGTVLQDFLNPGHETWGWVKYQYITTQLSHTPSSSEIEDILDEVGSMNFVPCYLGDPSPVARASSSDFVATDTLTTSVQSDLQ